MKPSYSDARNTAARATSSAVPARPSGILATDASADSAVVWVSWKDVPRIDARGQGVDTHAARSDLARQGAREGEDGTLAGGVDERPRMATLSTGQRGKVDDARATAGPCRRDEVGQGRPRDTTGAAQVDLHDLVPEGIVRFAQALARDQSIRRC